MEAPAIKIRRAQLDDAARLALIAQATFLETFAGVLHGSDIVEHCQRQHSPAFYAACFADPDAIAWIAETDPGQAPVGYLLASKCSLPIANLGPRDLEIKRIYVLGRFHGAGLGAALMNAALAQARGAGKRRISLGVYSRNDRAIAFYEKHGFRRVGERQFQVGGHAYDDLVLARELGDE